LELLGDTTDRFSGDPSHYPHNTRLGDKWPEMLRVAWQAGHRTIRGASVSFHPPKRHVTTNSMIEEESSGTKRIQSWRANERGLCQTVQQVAPNADRIATICEFIKVSRRLVAGILADD
jgi:hypothetical protein